jgi:hypothetical protein
MEAENPHGDMTEEELAAYFQAHKDDSAVWAQQGRGLRVGPEGVSTVFSVRLSPEQLTALLVAAEAAGTTTSEFIRSAALAEAERVSADPGRREELRAALELIRGALQLEETRPAGAGHGRRPAGAPVHRHM